MTETNDNIVKKPVELSEDEIAVLHLVVKDRLWWEEAVKRFKKISIIAGAVFAFLAVLATWWPWITRMVQFVIKDVPIE